MGINNFLKYIRDHHPDVIKNSHISEYAYQRVFLDISSYIYKYMSIYGKSSQQWITAILNLFIIFRNNNVHCIPVFDGKPPTEKSGEIDSRKEKRLNTTNRLNNLLEALENLTLNNTITNDQRKVIDTELENLSKKGKRTERLLRQSTKNICGYTPEDIKILQKYASSIQKQHINISSSDINLLKDILLACGINLLQSNEEAEGYCCFLVRNGIGSAVISCDSDCVAHGAYDVIFSINPDGSITHIDLNELLDSLELTEEQLIDFAILVGCDYNKHCKENKLGPVGAVKMLKKFGSIEHIEGINKECLLYERCRELFRPQFDQNIVIEALKYDNDKINKLIENTTIKRKVIDELIKERNCTVIFE